MPDTSETRGLLARNSEIRNEMMKRKDFSSNDFFLIQGKEEYQDTFTPNNKLEDTAGLRFTNAMSLNAYLNKGRFLDDKYITPSLTDFYGSNPQVSGNIGYFNIYTARNGSYDMEDGRIIDDYGSEAKFIKVEGNDLKDKQFYFLRRNLEKAKKYQPSKWQEKSGEFVFNTDKKVYSKENNDKGVVEENGYTSDEQEQMYETLYAGGRLNTIKSEKQNGLLKITQTLFERKQLRDATNTQSKNLTNKNGEYSRSWSKYKDYTESLKNLTGNYKDGNGNPLSISEIQRNYHNFRAGNTPESMDYLANNTVLENTGFVNIVRGRTDNKGNIKKCMFSIENLAWKDVPDGLNYLSTEQRGPNGGRIMWFPPYDISFNESVNVAWNDNTFIGRGEKVYTYSNTDRTGTLEFTLLIDHPNVINETDRNLITEEDVLRFFNGEQLLETKAKLEKEEIKDETKNPIPNPKEDPNREFKTIKFTIYFPNNYSGMYMYVNMPQLDRGKFIKNYSECVDDDWWTYLLIGSNTNYIKWSNESGADVSGGVYPQEWRGYEISPVNGLTDSTLSNYDIVSNPITDNSKLKMWDEVIEEEEDKTQGYHYRVDYDIKRRYDNVEKYSDSSSNMLNNYVVVSGSTDIYDSNGKDFSAAEAIMAIVKYGYEGNKFDKLQDYIVANSAISGRIDEIKSYLENFPIANIELNGSSSTSEGTADKDDTTIAERRAYAVKNFLENYLSKKKHEINNETFKIKFNSYNPGSSLEDEKKARFVDVIISFDTTNITTLSETATGTVSAGTDINITDNKGANSDVETGSTTSDILDAKKTAMWDLQSQRYENEADYFARITSSTNAVDKMTYTKIKEKIKYFNAAFHSMSPEGFNARLTFLQQCTRQGHTIEASDRNGFATTAGNLAFGRMPVCVLTLGDFINSRVIINSVSINYSDDGMQWDLNKTGAGVQPMFAKVSMQLVIIGGQSLGGPVSRLQNAVSFNYYANTGVYDDRADRVILGNSESATQETYENLWAPYPEEEKPQKVE